MTAMQNDTAVLFGWDYDDQRVNEAGNVEYHLIDLNRWMTKEQVKLLNDDERIDDHWQGDENPDDADSENIVIDD